MFDEPCCKWCRCLLDGRLIVNVTSWEGSAIERLQPQEISPADLARGIAPYFPSPPPPKADVGWRLFCHILRQCEQIKGVERVHPRNILHHQGCILNDADDCKYESEWILEQHSYSHTHRFCRPAAYICSCCLPSGNLSSSAYDSRIPMTHLPHVYRASFPS